MTNLQKNTEMNQAPVVERSVGGRLPATNIISTRELTNSQRFISDIISKTQYPLTVIAKHTKIPLNTLYDLLSGRTQTPQNKTFKRLFDFYCQVISTT